MASLPTPDLTTTDELPVMRGLSGHDERTLIALQRSSAMRTAAELEAHKLAVADVRARCGAAVSGPLGSRVARQVLELLADLP